jgi:agmatine deiminase
MKKRRVVLGLVQPSLAQGAEANMEKCSNMIRSAASRGARIICLPELFRSHYFPQRKRAPVDALAEPIPGPTTRTLSDLARETDAVIIAPIYERSREGRLFNSAAVIDAGGKLLGTYRKVHIPHDPFFYEKNFFRPGDSGFKVFKTRFASISILICFDQWFPEAARACALAGAEILFYPTAIGAISGRPSADGDWLDAWVTVQRGHAIANSVHVAAVNRVGREGRLEFWGNSFVSDSFGGVLAKASSRAEEVLAVEADLGHNARVREGWGFMRNRRPECYRSLSRPA